MSDLILIASGSEVSLALAARERLAESGVRTRVVSMPSWELFDAQPADYQESVLPASAPARLAVEAGASQGWHRDMWGPRARSSRSRDSARRSQQRRPRTGRPDLKALGLASFVDCFVCSCFVDHRRPDEEIFRIALDLVQASPDETVYIDDSLMSTVAQGLEIRSIHHSGHEATRSWLAPIGLS